MTIQITMLVGQNGTTAMVACKFLLMEHAEGAIAQLDAAMEDPTLAVALLTPEGRIRLRAGELRGFWFTQPNIEHTIKCTHNERDFSACVERALEEQSIDLHVEGQHRERRAGDRFVKSLEGNKTGFGADL